MKKDWRLNEWIYVFNEPNVWSPLLYFRKPKHASQEEFEILKELDPTYYLFDYNETMKGDLDEFFYYELDLIKKWNREITLRKLLNK